MKRAHKIKLEPTSEQELYFIRACGTARFAYNWGLSEWMRMHADGESVSEAHLQKKLNSIKRAQFPWMLDVTKAVPQQALKNLGIAYDNFFRNVKAGRKPGFPKFKKKGVRDSFRADNGPQSSSDDAVKVFKKAIKLPFIGWVRMRENVRFSGRNTSAVVSRAADGWYVSVLIDTHDSLSGPLDRGIVGVDLGIRALATLSDGIIFPTLKPNRLAHDKIVRLSRGVSRKKKGSNNRRKAIAKLSRLHLRIANRRHDTLHKLTTFLATSYSVIGIEDLNVIGMLSNHCTARSVADAGFAEFRRQLEYKAEMTGARVHVVSRWFPSSKMCSNCGVIVETLGRNPILLCECGNRMDRDVNAAINLKMAASSAVSACGEDGSGVADDCGVKPSTVKQEIVEACKCVQIL